MSGEPTRRTGWKVRAAVGAAAGILAVLLLLLLVLSGGRGLGRSVELAREGESLQLEALGLAHLADDLEADGRTDLAKAKREEAEALGARADALFAGAEEILERAGGRLGAENPALQVLRGVVAFHGGDYARARELLETAAEAPSASPERASLLVMLGTIARDSGDSRGAVELFRRAAELAPQDPEACFRLGTAYLEVDPPEQALPPLERAAEFAPTDGETHNALGLAYERMLRLDRAEAAFARAALVEPDRLDVVRNLEEVRKAKAARNDVAAAWKAFERGLEHETAAWRALEEGHADESVGRLIEATEAFRVAIASVANFHAAHFHRGRCYAIYGGGRSLIRERREYLAQAAEHFRAALTGRPRWEPYRFALARALRDLGRAQEAREVLRKILRDNPRSGKAHYELAYLHAYAHEDIPAARRELEAARRLGVNPDPVFSRMLDEIEGELKSPPPGELEKDARLGAEAAMGEGDILLASGDAAGAARAYSRAYEALAGMTRRQLVIMRAEAAGKAAVAFERTKDYSRALASYRKALELRPADRDFRENVSRLEDVAKELEGKESPGGKE